MARPKKEIDEEQVYKLACEGLTYDSIARFFNVDRSTIVRRFAPLIKEGHAELGRDIRQRIVKKALEKDDRTCLIYLDKRLNKDDDDGTIKVPVSSIKLKTYEPERP